MKNLAVFAGYYSTTGLPEETLNYISQLSISHDVIAVFDNDVTLSEYHKLKKYCCHVIYGRHGLYDFGSYKIGVHYAFENLDIDQYDSILIANDSVFLINNCLDEIFKEFDPIGRDDIWGIYENTMEKYFGDKNKSHLQSYFIRFGRNVIRNKCFIDFFFSIKKEKSKNDIIDKYEVGLTKYFVDNGFSYRAFVSETYNATVSFRAIGLLYKGFPFLKKSSLKESLFCFLFSPFFVDKIGTKEASLAIREYRKSIRILDVFLLFLKKVWGKFSRLAI